MLVRAAEVWADTPAVTSPLLKFFGELVHNRSGRISFPASSPDGYLLFREMSNLIVTYGFSPIHPSFCNSGVFA